VININIDEDLEEEAHSISKRYMCLKQRRERVYKLKDRE
jgi:hypothetical protein